MEPGQGGDVQTQGGDTGITMEAAPPLAASQVREGSFMQNYKKTSPPSAREAAVSAMQHETFF